MLFLCRMDRRKLSISKVRQKQLKFPFLYTVARNLNISLIFPQSKSQEL